MRKFLIGLVLALAAVPAWAGDCTGHYAKVDTIKADGDLYDAQQARFDLITPKPTNGDAALCAAAWKYRNAAEDDLVDSAECSDAQWGAVNDIYQGMSTIVGAYHCVSQ